ncbi:MBL fold metallo-hydrolase [Streptococcus caprae]
MIFKKEPAKELIFPAGVYLIEHAEKGYMLYDTGYASEVMRPTLRNLAYRLPNPIQMTEADTIDAQLRAQGIGTEDIGIVFVSHLHPDHIGRLKAFTKAQFILTKDCYQTYLKSRFRELVFRDYFPDDFAERLIILDLTQKSEVVEGQNCLDVFGDGSVIVYSLDGHARGQLCLHLPERGILLAADTLWRLAFINKLDKMRLIPRFIQQSYPAYLASAQVLKSFLAAGVRVLVSHEEPARVREVLYG